MIPGEVGERVDPGAARYGNFINYYEFNPTEERVSRLPLSLLRDLDLGGPSVHDLGPSVLGLDVGCNAGVMTPNYTFLHVSMFQYRS